MNVLVAAPELAYYARAPDTRHLLAAIPFELPPEGTLSQNDEHDPLPYYYRPGLGFLYRLRLSMALEMLPETGHILEVGVGSGILVPTLTRHYPRYTGTDLVLAAGLDRLAHPSCEAKFLAADLLDEEALPEQAYDAIVCISVLEHIRERKSAARCLARALKPGGTLVTGYPMVNAPMSRAFEAIGFLNIDHHHHSAPAEIERALSQELKRTRRTAVPPGFPVELSVYQVAAWTKSAR